MDLSMVFCELPEASRFMPLATGVPAVPRPHPKQPRDPRHEQKTKDRKNRRPWGTWEGSLEVWIATFNMYYITSYHLYICIYIYIYIQNTLLWVYWVYVIYCHIPMCCVCISVYLYIHSTNSVCLSTCKAGHLAWVDPYMCTYVR